MAGVIGKLSVRPVFLLFLPLPWTDDLLLLSSHSRGCVHPKQTGESGVPEWETAEAGSRQLWACVECRLLCCRSKESPTRQVDTMVASQTRT